ncbi:MAG: polysaccharide deacetylase family protein locus subfamily [Fibrobacteres bacterium]|nr:polysaccharide deacetylase family protein locus subfamily [Fibrobacterota bacterium]
MRPSPSVIVVKRMIDIAVGLVGTGAFLFFYPILAILIKMESPGPILYSQERVGINKRSRPREKGPDGEEPAPIRKSDVGGKPFEIYKFRSMRTDAEKNGPQLAAKGIDPRVTQVGWWLRALHLDELPQFWSVLRGDMSFIGPRPERAHFTVEFGRTIPHYQNRTLWVKPGLTGLAQISLGYDEGMESVVRKTYFDYSYRASFSHFGSWARMEWWVLMNTVGYLLIKPRKEGDTRDLASLKRVKLLNMLAHAPKKHGSTHKVTAWVKLDSDDRSMVLQGKDPSEITDRLARLSARGIKTLEVCYTPRKDFDLDDLGFLVDLSHRVNGLGGRMAVRDPSPRVHRMLQEIHMDKVVDLARPQSRVRNFMTVDVECWFHAYNLKEKVPPSTWHLQETRIVANMERILGLFRSQEAKATFFVLGWVAERFPEIVRMIASEGHEIGTHGYYHNLITDMTPASYEEDLAKSLEAIARNYTQPVIGHRASNFTIVPSTYWALEIMAKHGLKYDSSIFPIKRDRYGIPHYPNRLPHTQHLKSGKTMMEFPMSTLGVGNKFLPMSGGGYLRLFPHVVTETFIDSCNRKGHPAMVYFHPWELDQDQRRVSVGLVKTFQHYVNQHSLEWKLNRLMQKFAFTSIRDSMATRRVQVMLRRNPVYIPSHLGAQGDRDAIRAAERREAHDNPVIPRRPARA